MCKFVKHLLLLCTSVITSSIAVDCVYKACSCIETTINCENRQLTKMPDITSSNSYYLTLGLDMNEITDIPAGSLPPNLTAIYLTENPTSTISETALDGSAYTLDTLAFSSASFARIPDAFRSLKVLNSLTIRDSYVHDWNEEAMRNIGQTLISLDLENVGMKSWPDWLRYFTCLTELTISGGSISSVPDHALDNVTNTLITLSIYNNSLTTIPKAFSKFTALKNLYIQHNKIMDLTWLPQSSKLQSLSLNDNLISDANHLSNAVYPFKDSLAYFDINFNRLTAIPNITFLELVGTLDLSYNRFTDPYSGAFPSSVGYIYFNNNLLPAIPRALKTLFSLSSLMLSSNSITQIQASDISLSATMVDLGYNLITELTDNSFPINCQIYSLTLNNNPIVTISNMAFKNLGSLNDLYLMNTRLTRLPLALSSLTMLYILDMRNTANLVCTCQERNLQQLIKTMEKSNVLGTCGLMNIYDFFSKLSPLCPL